MPKKRPRNSRKASWTRWRILTDEEIWTLKEKRRIEMEQPQAPLPPPQKSSLRQALVLPVPFPVSCPGAVRPPVPGVPAVSASPLPGCVR